MGIQKIVRGHSRNSNLRNGKNKVNEDTPFLGTDSGDEFDDYELNDLHCELGMVEGQICSIPYELYNLPNLRDILSLETWNSCLTEEERFHLSAYLPDMDQQNFCLTLKELFDGSNLFFGNPMDVFFHRLRGGFYPPEVARYREGLHFLQRRKYYYSLRSYHDRMTQMFKDMKKLWNQCDKSSGVEERISLWTKSRKQREINLLDLNKFPRDDQLLPEEIGLDMKGMRSGNDDLLSLSANGMSTAPNCRGKGVLKMKTSANGLLPNKNVKVFGSDFSEQFQSVPKGVLKIVPKVPSVSLEQSEKATRGAQALFPVMNEGSLEFKLPPLPAYLQFPDAAGLSGPPFLRQKVDGSRPSQQPRCFLNQQGNTMRSMYQSESSTKKAEGRMIPQSHDLTVFGRYKLFPSKEREDLNEENELPIVSKAAKRYNSGDQSFWSNLRKGAEDFPQRSLEGFPFDFKYHREERDVSLMKEKHMSMIYPRLVDSTQRTTSNDNAKLEILALASSNPPRAEIETDILAKRAGKLSSASDRFRDSPVLPLTYKRRKGSGNVKSLFDTASGNTIMAGAEMNSNQQFEEGEKAVKLKYLRWKDMPINKEP